MNIEDMNIEEGLKLLRSEKYQEAYQYFWELSKRGNDKIALFYCLYIDYNYIGSMSIFDFFTNFKKLLHIKEPYSITVLLVLLGISLDLKDDKSIQKYTLKAISQNIGHPLVWYSYAAYCAKEDEKEVYLDKVIEDKDAQGAVLENAIVLKLDIIGQKDGDDAIKAYLNKLLIVLEDRQYIQYLILVHAIITESDQNTIEELAKELLSNEEVTKWHAETLYKLVQYYTNSGTNLEKAIECREKIIEITDDKTQAKIGLASTYYDYGYYQKTIDVLTTLIEEDKTDKLAFYLLADAYSKINGPEGRKKAIENYEKAYSFDQDFIIMRLLCEAYKKDGQYDKLLGFATKLYKYPQYRYYSAYLNSCYYSSKGLFDVALKYAKKAYLKKQDNHYEILDNLMLVEKNQAKLALYNEKMQQNENSYFFNRQKAKAFFHGEYGHIIDVKKALFEIQKAYELNKESSCVLSMYGNILLNDDARRAYKMFEQGSKRYETGEENCTCCLGFLAKCYYLGLGVQMDVEKAYKIVDDAIEKEGYQCSENLIHLYAYFRLVKNEELMKAYQLLTNHYERRFSYTRYYLMGILEKLMYGKTSKKTKKMMKESYRGGSLLEKKYYQLDNELIFPFMTNN